MDKAVQTGFRYEWIPDYVIPVLDRELGCDNQSLLAIAVVDKLLEVVLLLSLKFFHSEVIKDQQIRFLPVCRGRLWRVPADAPDQVFQAAAAC